MAEQLDAENMDEELNEVEEGLANVWISRDVGEIKL
jgi:hypothetical protein